jgi:hypothetical protein
VADTAIEWADVPGRPGYRVSTTGLIAGPQGPRKPQVTADGYFYIVTYRRGAGAKGVRRNLKLWAHRAVLEAFVGPCPPHQEVRHLNGNPSDNRLSNLAWGDRYEQAADRARHGTQPRGDQCASARLSWRQVEAIRADVRSSRVVGRSYGVSHVTIQKIRRGEKWVGLSDQSKGRHHHDIEAFPPDLQVREYPREVSRVG